MFCSHSSSLAIPSYVCKARQPSPAQSRFRARGSEPSVHLFKDERPRVDHALPALIIVALGTTPRMALALDAPSAQVPKRPIVSPA